MDTPPSSASPYLSWASALRIGSHTFLATWMLTVLAAAMAVFGVPLFSYVLGSGWVAPLVAALTLFGLLLVFKRLIFRNIYRNAADGDEAALLEYLVQHNVSGAAGEEEMEMELLENALHLKRVRAQNCMAPRPEIVHVDVQDSVEALRQVFIESSLSRVLVTEGDLDSVLGYVHVQQMFAQPRTIRSMTMPITFVPESIAVSDLLNKFIKNRTNIACVVDEYGSLSGLVTLEDALEQLFGDIDDEHDQEEFIEVQVGEREFLFSGRLKIDYLNEKYPALDFPPGDYQTLSGYLVTVVQNIPEQGQSLESGGKTFVFELVSDRKVETVRVMLPAS